MHEEGARRDKAKIFKISLSIITESLLELLSVLSGEFAIIVSHASNNVDLSPTVGYGSPLYLTSKKDFC